MSEVYKFKVVCKDNQQIELRVTRWEIGSQGELIVVREDGAVCGVSAGIWETFCSKEITE